MLVEIIEGPARTFAQRRARVQCEHCQKEREVLYRTVFKKETHPCASCSTTQRQTGRTYTKEHAQAISQSLRKKGWRLHCGYKEIMVDSDHPRKRMVKKGKYLRVYPYVFEHQLVMEASLGHFLETYELIHHVDGDRLHNDLSNLYLCTGEDAAACRREHNATHASLEAVAFTLVKTGIIEFVDGRYRLSERALSRLDLDSSVI